MAVLLKRALADCLSQGDDYERPKKASSVYDCCTFYWIAIPERMWTGELEFKFIENWADDVELTIEDYDINNNNNGISPPTTCSRSTTRTTTRPTSSIKIRSSGKMPAENWDDELVTCEVSSSWEEELFPEAYISSFYVSNKLFVESWDGDFYTENYIKSFKVSCLSFKESWDDELLF